MSSDPARPNIVFIITDQQRFDTIAALGHPHVLTPNLDRLVNEGVTFTNCHVSAPSCAPSRASLFTALYPHTTGILRNADSWKHSWIENLADSGYRCVNVGKMHSYPYHAPLGFHERYVVENKDRYLEERYYFDEWDKALKARGKVKQQREQYRERADYKECLGAFTWEEDEDLQSDNFVGDTATWWIDSYPKTEPLFLQIGFPGPHPPYDPTPKWRDHYMAIKDELPLLDVGDEEMEKLPRAFKELRAHNAEIDHDSVHMPLEPTEEQRRRQRAYYLANVSMIDEKIGEIMESLDRKGYLDNTVIVFTSDHGDCLSDHGMSQKWTMYDTIMKMPLIVWGPGRFEGGRTVDGLCQQFDIAPALLELAGATPPKVMEAKSLLPALEGGEWEPRDFVYAEHIKDGILDGTEYMSMVRDDRWKLVHFIGEDEGQLFDLDHDPDEVVNLWGEEAHREKKAELLHQLLEWRTRSVIEGRDWAADYR